MILESLFLTRFLTRCSFNCLWETKMWSKDSIGFVERNLYQKTSLIHPAVLIYRFVTTQVNNLHYVSAVLHGKSWNFMRDSHWLIAYLSRLMALCLGLPGWAGIRKEKPIWILRRQETVSCSGISWAICMPAPHSRQITTPASHRSVVYWLDALLATQPTVSQHWKHKVLMA